MQQIEVLSGIKEIKDPASLNNGFLIVCCIYLFNIAFLPFSGHSQSSSDCANIIFATLQKEHLEISTRQKQLSDFFHASSDPDSCFGKVLDLVLAEIYDRSSTANEYLFQALESALRNNSIFSDSLTGLFYHKYGVALYIADAYPEAVAQYDRAILFRKNYFGNVHKDIGRSYMNAGIACSQMDAFFRASKYLKQAVAILQELGEEHLLVQSQYELGWAYRSFGDYKNALLYLDLARAGYEHLYGPEDIDVALTEDKLGVCLYESRKPAEAIGHFQYAVRIYEQLGDSSKLGNTLNNMALALDANGRHRLALSALQRARKIHRAVNDGQERFLFGDYMNTANTLKHMNALDSALVFMDSALQLAPILAIPGDYAESLDNLGNIYELKGEYFLAEEAYLEAARHLWKDFGEMGVAGLLALTNLDAVITPVGLLAVLSDQARLRKRILTKRTTQASLDSALLAYDAVAHIGNLIQRHFTAEDSKLSWIEKMRTTLAEAIEILEAQYKKDKNPRYIEKAFQYFEQGKSLLLLQNFIRTQFTGQDKYAQLFVREKQIHRKITSLENELLKASSDRKRLQDSLSKWQLQLSALVDVIRENYPEYFETKYSGKPISLNHFKNDLLPGGGHALYFYQSGMNIFTLTIGKNYLNLNRIENSNQLTNDIITLNSLACAPPKLNNSKTEIAKVSKRISQQLFQANPLPESTKRLLIIPDGILNLVPFDILIPGPSDQFLIESNPICYSYSATLLSKNASHAKGLPMAWHATAIAPDYSHDSRLPPLKEADKEVMAAGEFAEEIAVINDPGESLMSFKKKTGDAHLIHLAMHARAGQDEKNNAYLQFPEGDVPNWEISNMDLNAKLVVLSACETGRGKLYPGEGVFSLGRSFMHAGVPSVIMSAWKSNDAATARIIETFYDELSNGRDFDVALQQAKIAYLQAPLDETGHPYYWAGMTQYGWFATQRAPYRVFLIILITVISLFAGFYLVRKIFRA